MDGAKTPKGKKWLAFFKIKMPINISKLPEMSEDEISKRVDSFMKKVKEITVKVEEQLVNNIDRIINE